MIFEDWVSHPPHVSRTARHRIDKMTTEFSGLTTSTTSSLQPSESGSNFAYPTVCPKPSHFLR